MVATADSETGTGTVSGAMLTGLTVSGPTDGGSACVDDGGGAAAAVAAGFLLRNDLRGPFGSLFRKLLSDFRRERHRTLLLETCQKLDASKQVRGHSALGPDCRLDLVGGLPVARRGQAVGEDRALQRDDRPPVPQCCADLG